MPTACAAPAQLALPFLLPEPPAVVDGIPGQLDLVAAVYATEASARPLADLDADHLESRERLLRVRIGRAIGDAKRQPLLDELAVVRAEIRFRLRVH